MSIGCKDDALPHPSPGDEHAWAARVASGEQGDFNRFVKENHERACAIARRLLGNQADAEEAVQDSFCNLYVSMTGGLYRPAESPPPAFLLIILRRRCVDILRRRMARQAYEAIAAQGGHGVSRADGDPLLGILVAEALDRLEPSERKIVKFLEEGLSKEEIAADLGKSVRSVQLDCAKIRKKMAPVRVLLRRGNSNGH